MKRFLIVISTLGVLGLALYYAVTYHGFYIDVGNNGPISVDFQVNGKEIIDNSTGMAFVIKGVDITADMPGKHAGDFGLSKDDYLRWLKQIGDMGANTIRTQYIMDGDFYGALFEYNTSHAEPLYLICSISVNDEVNYGYEDAYSDAFLGQLKDNSFKTIDVVHGNRTVKMIDTAEKYTSDVSDWVLGYIIGTEWNSDMITYTNNQKAYSGVYVGEYFSTAEGAQPFEAVMAEVMDELTKYETEKYDRQCPVGFINDPQNDFLEYKDDFAEPLDKFHLLTGNEKIYARDLNKVNRIDAEKVKPTEKMQAGTFAAYRLFDFCSDFYNYLSEEEKIRVSKYADFSKITADDSYDGYLQLLGAYHTMPLIGGFGYSSSRGTTDNTAGMPYTEEQQGNKLVAVYNDMIGSKWSGGIINSWQDRWEGKSWNTAFAKDLTNSMEWKDVQTEATGNGILEFDSNTVSVDGVDNEWTDGDYWGVWNGLSLYVKMDGEGLCFVVKGGGKGQRKYQAVYSS